MRRHRASCKCRGLEPTSDIAKTRIMRLGAHPYIALSWGSPDDRFGGSILLRCAACGKPPRARTNPVGRIDPRHEARARSLSSSRIARRTTRAPRGCSGRALSAFRLLPGAPLPVAPPCIRHRCLPFTAGEPHGLPLRVRAQHLGLRCMGQGCLCMGSILVFALGPAPLGDSTDDGLAAGLHPAAAG